MFKCKICGKKYTELTALYNHIESKHKDMIPQDMTVQQYYYYMKTGKMNGNCVMCKQPTSWNSNTGKYNRFCGNPKCKDEYVKIMKSRMVAKYGKTHLLNDPNKQREMLANRSISGVYVVSCFPSDHLYTPDILLLANISLCLLGSFNKWVFPYLATILLFIIFTYSSLHLGFPQNLLYLPVLLFQLVGCLHITQLPFILPVFM